MKYTYDKYKKNFFRMIAANSILLGNKNAVASLISQLKNYTERDRAELKRSLANIEIGNMKDFENFLRIFEFQLADEVNSFNINLIKTQGKLLTGSANLAEVLKVQAQFEKTFVNYLQNNSQLTEIISTYLKLAIHRLSSSNILENVRVARQLKRLRKAMIENEWAEVSDIFDEINGIINETYLKLIESRA